MADTFIISAFALYKATHYTGNDSNNEIGINVSKLQGFSPRFAWLKRYIVPGQNQVQYLLTFEVNSIEQLDSNTLSGVYIEVSAEGVLIDCISIDNFIAAADGTGVITRQYAGGVPAFTSPTPTAYCLVRSDAGTASAANQVVMDYVLQMIGNVSIRSTFSGVSHYSFSSYTIPKPIGNDLITSGACSS